MRTRAVVAGVLVAAVVGGGAIWAASTTTADESILLPPLQERGEPHELAEVKAAGVDLLTSEDALGRVTAEAMSDAATAREKAASAVMVAALEDQAEDVLTPERADEVVPSYVVGLEQVLTDPEYRDLAYTDNAFRTTADEGAVVDGDTALVRFRGSPIYRHLDGAWDVEPESQFTVHLVRDPSATRGWVLDDWTSRFVDQSG